MRKSVLPLLAFSTLMLLNACEKPPVITPPVQEPYDESGHAADCVVNPNPLAPESAPKIDVTMAVGNDGGWCAVRMPQVKTALLRAAPQHGAIYFRNVRDISRLQYTPAAGYAGNDSFTFEVLPGNAKIVTAVTVKAPPSATPATGAETKADTKADAKAAPAKESPAKESKAK